MQILARVLTVIFYLPAVFILVVLLVSKPPQPLKERSDLWNRLCKLVGFFWKAFLLLLVPIIAWSCSAALQVIKEDLTKISDVTDAGMQQKMLTEYQHNIENYFGAPRDLLIPIGEWILIIMGLILFCDFAKMGFITRKKSIIFVLHGISGIMTDLNIYPRFIDQKVGTLKFQILSKEITLGSMKTWKDLVASGCYWLTGSQKSTGASGVKHSGWMWLWIFSSWFAGVVELSYLYSTWLESLSFL